MQLDYFFFYTESNIVCMVILAIMLFNDKKHSTRREKQIWFNRTIVAHILYFVSDIGWAAVLSSQDEKLDLKEHTLSAREKGEAEVTVNLFGLFPIGRMRVTAGEETRLMPGGAAVGVALKTDGGEISVPYSKIGKAKTLFDFKKI